jgi:hypothetical protein
MSTTVDDLIDLKDEAVAASHAAVAAWEQRDLNGLEAAARFCQEVVDHAARYDAADLRDMALADKWTDFDVRQLDGPHPKVPHGLCPVCRHYGADCTGIHPAEGRDE